MLGSGRDSLDITVRLKSLDSGSTLRCARNDVVGDFVPVVIPDLDRESNAFGCGALLLQTHRLPKAPGFRVCASLRPE